MIISANVVPVIHQTGATTLKLKQLDVQDNVPQINAYLKPPYLGNLDKHAHNTSDGMTDRKKPLTGEYN